MEILLSIAVFVVVCGSVLLLLAPKEGSIQEEAIQRRLEAIAAKPSTVSSPLQLPSSGEETIWEWTAKFFLGEKELAQKYTAGRSLLHQAGYPGERAARAFWGMRIFLTGTFAAAAFLLATIAQASVSNLVLLIVLAAGLGYFLPYLHVRRRAALRTLLIQETLPDTLDLLVVCVEAGLGVDAALVRVAREQAEQGLAIGEELQLTSQEMQAGVSRREALSRLADRVGLDDLRALIAFLIQTEELGGSIARSLRVYASTLRDKRSQKAEEAARKAVIKLVFPMVLFILPALFLVILGPAGMNVLKLLSETAAG
jgi:tight adherence protein C